MKVGVITLMAALLVALPALAGTGPDCGPVDTDSDTVYDLCDNCDAIPNTNQLDGDQDGYGDVCDCDYSTATNGVCDGGDFLAFIASPFGSTVPPTNCEFDNAPNNAVDGGDFLWFVGRFAPPLNVPGPACGNASGTPCPTPGTPCP